MKYKKALEYFKQGRILIRWGDSPILSESSPQFTIGRPDGNETYDINRNTAQNLLERNVYKILPCKETFFTEFIFDREITTCRNYQSDKYFYPVYTCPHCGFKQEVDPDLMEKADIGVNDKNKSRGTWIEECCNCEKEVTLQYRIMGKKNY